MRKNTNKDHLMRILAFLKADNYSIADISRLTGINANTLYNLKRTDNTSDEKCYLIMKKIREAIPEEYYRVLGLMMQYHAAHKD